MKNNAADGTKEHPFEMRYAEYLSLKIILGEAEQKYKAATDPEEAILIRNAARADIWKVWPYLYDDCYVKVIN